MPISVKNALDNHYLVDKFTDNHSTVKQAKQLFSAKRKRFAGIALDVLFDHFLIKHWQKFHHLPILQFKQHSYELLNERITAMPTRMQQVITNLTQNDWFKEYETLQGIGLALDNIAKRIRFANNFSGSIEDINHHYGELEALFLTFFPRLINHVNQYALESGNAKNTLNSIIKR